MHYNTTNPFTLGQVLSITHERLMCEIGGVYAILNHMTGQSLFTHQLPAAGKAAKPVLCQCHPDIAGLTLDHVTRENWREVLDKLIEQHGNSFEVPVLTDWTYSDPVQSAVDMFGEEKVITVKA